MRHIEPIPEIGMRVRLKECIHYSDGHYFGNKFHKGQLGVIRGFLGFKMQFKQDVTVLLDGESIAYPFSIKELQYTKGAPKETK